VGWVEGWEGVWVGVVKHIGGAGKSLHSRSCHFSSHICRHHTQWQQSMSSYLTCHLQHAACSCPAVCPAGAAPSLAHPVTPT
jgi:hypothetical protein